MLELEKKEKYDPRTYGELKADFLNKIDPVPYVAEEMPDQEKKRQELLKDIMEGKFILKR